MSDDAPGPLELIAADLYPVPGPGGQLLGGASGALSGWEASTGPLGQRVSDLGAEGVETSQSLAGLGPALAPGMQYWNQQTPSLAPSALASVLNQQTPLQSLGQFAPVHPGDTFTPPNTQHFMDLLNADVQQLFDELQSWVLSILPVIPRG